MTASGPVSTELSAQWSRLMRLQVELAFAAEIPFFLDCGDWSAAQRVVDLGCGTGHYLEALRQRFPDKDYTGVECDPDHAETARSLLSNGAGRRGVTVVNEDLFAFRGQFDAVVVRLVAQHLAEPERLFEVADRLLAPGGTLVVVESLDGERRFVPAVPSVEEIFVRFRAARRAARCDRDAGCLLVRRAREHGFEVHRERRVHAASTPGDRRDLFVETYRTVFSILRLDFNVQYDYVGAVRALRAWSMNPEAYAQIGVQLACYRRAGSRGGFERPVTRDP